MTRMRGLSAACGRHVTFRAETGAPDTAATYTLVLGGAYGGTTVQWMSASLLNVSDSISFDAGSMIYTLGNVSINAVNGVVSINPSYPRSTSASVSEQGGLNANLPLVVGVAVGVFVLTLVVALYVRLSSSKSDSKCHAEHHAASFENPIYDQRTAAVELVQDGDPWMDIPKEYRPESRSASTQASTIGDDEEMYGFGGDTDSYLDVAEGGGFGDVDDTPY